MDVKVYTKEEVKQPKGNDYILKPNIIDIFPLFVEDEEGVELLSGAVELNDNSNNLLEQECALSTIWQKGLDPLELTSGIRWTEAILEEISPLQLIEDITNAVAEVSTAVSVTYDTVTDTEGNTYLSYKLTANA